VWPGPAQEAQHTITNLLIMSAFRFSIVTAFKVYLSGQSARLILDVNMLQQIPDASELLSDCVSDCGLKHCEDMK
jgi:hypothetical protein